MDVVGTDRWGDGVYLYFTNSALTRDPHRSEGANDDAARVIS